MGDLATHAEIAQDIAAALDPKWTGDEFIYLELGSFMTDVSQFNDPPSFLSKKLARKLKLKKDYWRIPSTALSPAFAFLDELLGVTGSPGELSAYFRSVVRALARLVFCDFQPFMEALKRSSQAQSIDRQATAFERSATLRAERKGRSQQDGNEPNAGERKRTLAEAFQTFRLPAEHFDALFDMLYTQYFPHEHLDMPPWELPPRSGSPALNRYPSGLIYYLEDYKRYIIEGLVTLEQQIIVPGQALDDQGEQIARLGHLMHAVEDYYFHSNFTEIHQSHYPLKLKTPSDIRKHNRRLRFPMFRAEISETSADGDYSPSTRESADASDLLYTGFFGGQDLNHSLVDALHGLTDFFELLLGPLHQIAIGSKEELPVLLRVVIDPTYRAQLGSELARDQAKRAHREDILFTDGVTTSFERSKWQQLIGKWQGLGFLSASAAADLRDAFERDVALTLRHPVLAKQQPMIGIGVVVIDMLAEAEAEQRKSDSRAAELDKTRWFWEPTYSGISEETIGTHSLMCKDSRRKSPYREETFAFAAFASIEIARAMLRRRGRGDDDGRRVDWVKLVDTYLRSPDLPASHTQESWERRALASKGRRRPDPGSPATPLPLVERAQQDAWGVKGARELAEARYREMEGPAETGSLPQWRSPNDTLLPPWPGDGDPGHLQIQRLKKPAVDPIEKPAMR